MNITTLQKCVEELKKETPNISYVLGMLETVIEINGIPTYTTPPIYPSQPYPLPPMPNSIYVGRGNVPLNSGTSVLSDEEIALQKYNGGGPVAELGTV